MSKVEELSALLMLHKNLKEVEEILMPITGYCMIH